MHPEDILLWPDGFWCFREEHCDTFLRGDDYRLVFHLTDEWRELSVKGPAFAQ